MGKIGLAIDLIERTAKFARTCGKESVLVTKPQNLAHINFSSLKTLKPLSADVCTFTKDPTLTPELLDDLLKVKGTQTEQVMQIKDRFLSAMGYKPELVKKSNFQGNTIDLSVDFFNGTISAGSKEFKLTQLIPEVRHELDHLDKAAKIVKSEGVEAFESALNEGLAKANLHARIPFDRDFWLKFSEDANIRGFDSKKYLEAVRNYPYDATMGTGVTSTYNFYNKWHAYSLNELEKSAYTYQKKLLRYYGEDDTVLPDNFGENFRKIKDIMDKYIAENKIKPIEHFSEPGTFDILSDISIGISDPGGRKALKYFQDLQSGRVEANKEKLLEMVKTLKDIAAKFTVQEQKAYFDRIYDWLREGKFTIHDFDFS